MGKQKFYCKKCNNITSMENEDHYYNWKCEICGNIIKEEDYTPYIIKGLPNTKI
jgi:ribosomal protein L37AE/L43A